MSAVADMLEELAGQASEPEARYLVDAYYQVQKFRIQTGNRIAAEAAGDNPPRPLMDWLYGRLESLEHDIQGVLQDYAEGQPICRWAMSIVGIGPVLAAGLAAHIDITKAPTVGHIWRFAGLDPTVEWKAGEVRPWNARLKTLCWKIGKSFVMTAGRPGSFYGALYYQRKEYETQKNERGEYAEQAARLLQSKRYGDNATRRHLEQGKLSPAHIDARARRWVVKLFLAHWHRVAYELHYGTPPPKPYAVEHLGHVDVIAPPNWPME